MARRKRQRQAKALFGAGAGADAPVSEITAEDLTDGTMDILTLMVKAGLVASKSEARRAVEQGGASVEGEKVTDIKKTFTAKELAGGLLVRRGKKNYRKVILK